MARLPTLTNFQVASTGPAGTEVRAPDVSSFARPARDMANVANDAAQSAEAYNQEALRATREANQIRVLDAENQARQAMLDLAYNADDGYTQVKGGDVVHNDEGPLSDRYGTKLDTRLSDIGATLGNDMQREMFARTAGNLKLQFGSQVQQYQNQEYRGYQLSVLKGARDLASEEIAQAHGDPDKIEAALTGRLLPAVDAYGRLQGASANEIVAQQNVQQSAALRGAINSQIVGENITAANDLFERYKDRLVEEDRIALEATLKKETDGRIVLGLADEAIGALGTDSVSLGMPVEGGRVTGRFGDKRPDHDHNGVDIAVPAGSPVRATIAGTVKVGENPEGGKQLFIVSDDGKTKAGFAHLNDYKVQPGARVTKGQIVAESGNTGRSTGPHLHYTLTVNGEKTDPLKAPKPATVEDALARAESSLHAQYPNASPELLKRVREEVTYRWNVREAGKKDAEDQAVLAAQTALVKNGGDYNALPASVRAAVPAGKVDEVMGFAGRLRNGARDPINDDVMFNDAVSDPKGLAGMNDAAFLNKYAGHPQFGSIATYRAQVQGKKQPGGKDTTGDLDYAAINRAVSTRLNGLGLAAFPKDDPKAAAQVGAIKRVVTGLIVSQQTRLGRQLTDAEIEQATNSVFMQQTPMVNTFLGIGTTDGTPKPTVLIGIDKIPTATRRNIEGALTRNRVPITAEAVLSAYYAGAR